MKSSAMIERVREVRSLNGLLQDHLDWRIHFRSSVCKRDALDVATVRLDTICKMGIWLHGDGTQLGDLVAELRQKHAEFHLAAAEVAAVCNDGEYGLGEQMVGPGSAFMQASSAVRTALFDLVARTRR